jgi:hypothetical protein
MTTRIVRKVESKAYLRIIQFFPLHGIIRFVSQLDCFSRSIVKVLDHRNPDVSAPVSECESSLGQVI